MSTVESIKYLFLNAGTSWILWLLAVLSLLSVGITVERFFAYRRLDSNLEKLARKLQSLLESASIEDAIQALEGDGTTASRVGAAGLRLAHRGPKAVERAMQSRLALEREVLDKRLVFLGTLGNNAPFVGLFGTVIGVIQAFEELGHGAAGHGAEAASQVASSAVMSAIAEALVATAVGIAVALPAVAAYNYLQRRVTSILSGTETITQLVLAYLVSEKEETNGR